MTKRFLPLVLVALSTGLVLGQGCPITTTFNHNNGQSGNMFDVVALNPAGITVTSVDVNVDAGTWNFEIYVVAGGGSHVGNETNPAAWTLVGSATGVVSNGAGVPTPLPIPINVTIPSGGVQGFYVTVTNGVGSSRVDLQACKLEYSIVSPK